MKTNNKKRKSIQYYSTNQTRFKKIQRNLVENTTDMEDDIEQTLKTEAIIKKKLPAKF